MKRKRNTIDDILSRIEPVTESGCYIWTGLTSKEGYGRCRFNGKEVKVHRILWEHERGPIPDGLVPDHLCRVRCCANINHLELVTPVENVLRGVSFSGLNKKKTHCKYGHPFIEGNLRIVKNRPNERRCLTCDRAKTEAYNRMVAARGWRSNRIKSQQD